MSQSASTGVTEETRTSHRSDAEAAVATANKVSEEDMAAFHPTIRNIIFAPNHFVALGLEPKDSYTDADILEAYTRKLKELMSEALLI